MDALSTSFPEPSRLNRCYSGSAKHGDFLHRLQPPRFVSFHHETLMIVSKLRTHRLANFVETAVIMATLFGLLAFIAWLFAGATGIAVVCLVGIPALIFGGAPAGRMVLSMYRAKPLTYRLPWLVTMGAVHGQTQGVRPCTD